VRADCERQAEVDFIFLYVISNKFNYINFKMGTRLYEEFMRKLKVPPVQRMGKKGHTDHKEIVIAIPLKGG
jgi:hypothetical protein